MKTKWEEDANWYRGMERTLPIGSITELLQELSEITIALNAPTLRTLEKTTIITAFAAYAQSIAHFDQFISANSGIDWDSFGRLVDVVNIMYEAPSALGGHLGIPVAYLSQDALNHLTNLLASEIATLRCSFTSLSLLYPAYKQVLPIAPLCRAAAELKAAEKYPILLMQVSDLLLTLDLNQQEHRICFLRQVAVIGEAVVQTALFQSQQAATSPLKNFLDVCKKTRDVLDHAEAEFSTKMVDQVTKGIIPDVRTFVRDGAITGFMQDLLPHGYQLHQLATYIMQYSNALATDIAMDRVQAITDMATHDLPCPYAIQQSKWYKLQKLLALQSKTSLTPSEAIEHYSLDKEFFEITKDPIINPTTCTQVLDKKTGAPKEKVECRGMLVGGSNTLDVTELALFCVTDTSLALDSTTRDTVTRHYLHLISSVTSRSDLSMVQKTQYLLPFISAFSTSTDKSIINLVYKAIVITNSPIGAGAIPHHKTLTSTDYDIAGILEQMIQVASLITQYKDRVVFGSGDQKMAHSVREYYQCVFGSYARALLDTDVFVQNIDQDSELYHFLNHSARVARNYLAHNQALNLSKPEDCAMDSSTVFSSVIEEMRVLKDGVLYDVTLLAQQPVDTDVFHS